MAELKSKKLSDVLADNVEKVGPKKESTEDKIRVTNISDKRLCLANNILNPGDKGNATRAEFGTLWQFLELNEKV